MEKPSIIKMKRHAASQLASSILERDVLAAVKKFLRLHPKVAWVERINSGAQTIDANRIYNGRRRYIKYGFIGCSDIIGQLKDGRFLAVECKRPGGHLTPAQRNFIALVINWNGVAGCVSNVDEAERLLA